MRVEAIAVGAPADERHSQTTSAVSFVSSTESVGTRSKWGWCIVMDARTMEALRHKTTDLHRRVSAAEEKPWRSHPVTYGSQMT